MRTVDIAFLGCLVIVFIMVVVLLTAFRVARLEPTPAPYATPTPFVFLPK